MQRDHRNRFTGRGGAAALDVIVTISVIALIVALVGALLLSARSAARSTLCRNRLRQIGLAYQGFRGTFGVFPPLQKRWKPGRREFGVPPVPASAHYYLLPFLDELAVYERIELTGDDWQFSDPPVSGLNAWTATLRIPQFTCPDDGARGAVLSYPICQGTSSTGYATPDFRPPNTVLPGVANGVRPSGIHDGQSNTIAFSERLAGDGRGEQFDPVRDYAIVSQRGEFSVTSLLPDSLAETCETAVGTAPEHRSHNGRGWLFGYFTVTEYNHVLTPNAPVPDCGFGPGIGVYSARSLHPHGVHVCLVDGAVDGVSDHIDTGVWRAMSTPDGGELQNR